MRKSEWTLNLLKFVIIVQTPQKYSHSLDVARFDDNTSVLCTQEQKDCKLPICEDPASSRTCVYLKEKRL